MVTVDEIINDLDPHQREIAEELRSLIRDTVPDAEEKIRKGKIVYAAEGKDFVWINPFTDHVDLEFMCGARLISGQLKGRGRKTNVEHLEISDKEDINEDKLRELIKEASKIVC
ncbi:MAG: DUF1801 domain-containing protein [Thermoproteota archaeon]